jgi:CheY-like chemotaxis protein
LARKILLADDSVTAQNMGRKILTDAGYEVLTVNNGSAALKRVSEQRPDLIVLDVYMPGYSGLEVCQRLKDSGDTSRIPILLTVGKLEPFKPEDARRVSADAFIVKPFEASELLSALTRLEDRIVPNGDSTRFSNTVSGIERFVSESTGRRCETGESGDTGWKSRIRFPSKKKVEDPEPEPDYVTPQSFRDFKRTPAIPASPPEAVPEVRQEPGLVSDLPHDITPDELDALSALVAKLDGQVPQEEEIAPIGEKLGQVTENKENGEAATTDKSPETSDASRAPTTPVEIPLANAPAAETTVESAAAITDSNVAPASQAEPDVALAAAAAAEIATAGPAEESAPIDQDDEPFFATAAAAVPQPEVEEAENPPENKQLEVAKTESQTGDQIPPAAARAASSEMPLSPSEQPQPASEEQNVDRAKVEEMLAEAVSEHAVAELETTEDHVPTEEELAEALRLLTPVPEKTSQHRFDHKEAVVAEKQSSESSATHTESTNGSRWRAEAVEPTAEEQSVSLEAEMFRGLSLHTVEETSSIPNAEGASAETEVSQASVSSDQTGATAAVEEREADHGASMAPQEPLTQEMASAPQEVASDALASPFPTVASENNSVTLATAAEVQEYADATSSCDTNRQHMGDEQDMGKDAKTDQGKGSKGWHPIRAAAVSTPKQDLVEAAKSGETEQGEGTPKAMAAAAASDDTASPADSSAIASIVDSVLADLRPKIVEEIAKKLGKK